jgi:hypothetical protein
MGVYIQPGDKQAHKEELWWRLKVITEQDRQVLAAGDFNDEAEDLKEDCAEYGCHLANNQKATRTGR